MRIVFILIAFTLFSCGNKKAEIVERQKELKKEIQIQSNRQDSLEYALDNLNDKSIKGDAFNEMVIQFSRAKTNKNNLQAEYDSLEMELKKY